MTRSASLRRSRMAREAAAMWPGNQLTAPPPALNAISPARFAALVTPRILYCTPAMPVAPARVRSEGEGTDHSAGGPPALVLVRKSAKNLA